MSQRATHTVSVPVLFPEIDAKVKCLVLISDLMNQSTFNLLPTTSELHELRKKYLKQHLHLRFDELIENNYNTDD